MKLPLNGKLKKMVLKDVIAFSSSQGIYTPCLFTMQSLAQRMDKELHSAKQINQL